MKYFTLCDYFIIACIKKNIENKASKNKQGVTLLLLKYGYLRNLIFKASVSFIHMKMFARFQPSQTGVETNSGPSTHGWGKPK